MFLLEWASVVYLRFIIIIIIIMNIVLKLILNIMNNFYIYYAIVAWEPTCQHPCNGFVEMYVHIANSNLVSRVIFVDQL